MPIREYSVIRWLGILILCGILLVACEAEPVGQDGTPDGAGLTEIPTAIAASEVSPGGAGATSSVVPSQPVVRFFVQDTDKVVFLVSLDGERTRIGEGDFRSPIESTLPGEHVADGRVYVLSIQGLAESQVFVVGSDGVESLDFIQGVVQGLAVWPGSATEPARLAWSTYNVVEGGTDLHSQIVVSDTDGSNLQVLLDQTDEERILAVGRWSEDGNRLYFSKEPIGLGGYILFGGATDLWVYDFEGGNSKQLFSDALGFICIDDLSPDETYIAQHCALEVLGVVNLDNGDIGTIAAPAGLGDKTVVGGARFDPSGRRLAYTLALNNPEAEQGWAAVSDSLDGSSDLLAEAPPGDYFRVATWLNENSIVLQSWGATPGLWFVREDGSELRRISDGIFLGVDESP